MMRTPNRASSSASLEELLIREKLLTPEQVSQIQSFMATTGMNFGTGTMFLGIVPAFRIAELLTAQKRIRAVAPQKVSVMPHVKSVLSPERAKEHQVFPLQSLDESGTPVLVLGMTDPLESVTIQRLESMVRARIQPVFLSLEDLQWCYRKYYRSGLSLFPQEQTMGGEKTINRRLNQLGADKTGAGAASALSFSQQQELKSLIRILIRKGVITQEELSREMAKNAP